MLVTLNEVLRDAKKNKYAVGLFNTVNLENGGPRKVSPFFIPMMIGNIATGNVAIRFNA